MSVSQSTLDQIDKSYYKLNAYSEKNKWAGRFAVPLIACFEGTLISLSISRMAIEDLLNARSALAKYDLKRSITNLSRGLDRICMIPSYLITTPLRIFYQVVLGVMYPEEIAPFHYEGRLGNVDVPGQRLLASAFNSDFEYFSPKCRSFVFGQMKKHTLLKSYSWEAAFSALRLALLESALTIGLIPLAAIENTVKSLGHLFNVVENASCKTGLISLFKATQGVCTLPSVALMIPVKIFYQVISGITDPQHLSPFMREVKVLKPQFIRRPA